MDNNNHINLFKRDIENKNCPICGGGPLHYDIYTNPKTLFTQERARCCNCGLIFDEEKWNSINEAVAEEKETIQEKLEPVEDSFETSDLAPNVNLLIFKTSIKQKQEHEEALYNNILNQVKNGVVILPGYIDFVGAYSYDPNTDVATLFSNGEPHITKEVK